MLRCGPNSASRPRPSTRPHTSTMNNIPFNRTVCACDQCVKCCKQQPGYALPGEPERIAERVGKPVEELFWASPGATVMDTRTKIVSQIRTITPQFKDGRCVLLGPDDRCTVHDIAPFGCAYFDTHQGRTEGHNRSVHGLKILMNDPDYAKLRSRLPLATHHKPRPV